MAGNTKIKHTDKLLEYIGDSDNDFPTRRVMALEVLGYSQVENMYKLFTKEELSQIEEEGLELRKKRSAPQRSAVYAAMLKEAKAGNVKAMREYLDRTEGKVIDRKEITGKDGAVMVPVLNVTLTSD